MHDPIDRKLAGIQETLAELRKRIALLEEISSVDRQSLEGLGPQTPLYTKDMKRLLGCGVESIRRRVAEGELPAPFSHGGRHCWLAGTVRDALQKSADRATQKQKSRSSSRSRFH